MWSEWNKWELIGCSRLHRFSESWTFPAYQKLSCFIRISTEEPPGFFVNNWFLKLKRVWFTHKIIKLWELKSNPVSPFTKAEGADLFLDQNWCFVFKIENGTNKQTRESQFSFVSFHNFEFAIMFSSADLGDFCSRWKLKGGSTNEIRDTLDPNPFAPAVSGPEIMRTLLSQSVWRNFRDEQFEF